MSIPASTLQATLAALRSAPDAHSAATALSEGLDAAALPAVIALLRPGYGNVELIVGAVPPSAELETWLTAPDAVWHTWHAPRLVRAGIDDADLDSPPPADSLLVPVGSRTLYGLIAVAEQTAPDTAPLLLLLAAVLEDRLSYFDDARAVAATLSAARERDTAVLIGLNTIERDIARALDAEALWNALHQNLDLLFDVTSYFIGLYRRDTDQLALPLVVENGTRTDEERHNALPLIGFSRAVIGFGTELHFADLDAEAHRLEALHIERDEREPGAFAAAWMGVPLRDRQNEVVGLIALQNMTPAVYDDGDLSLLMTVAGQVGMALENLRLTQLERERRELANALLDMGQIVTMSHDYGEALEHLLEQMQRVARYDSACVLLTMTGGASERTRDDMPPESAPDGVTLLFYAGSTSSLMTGETVYFEAHTPLIEAYSARIPLLLTRTEIEAAWHSLSVLPQAEHWQAALIVPMLAGNRVIGLLTLARFAPRSYTEGDARAAFALARIGALAVELARLRAQWQASDHMQQARARRLASLYELTGVVTSTLRQAEVLNTAARLLKDLYNVDHVGIMLIERTAEGDAAAHEVEYGILAAEYPDQGNRGMKLSLADNPIHEQMMNGEVVRIGRVELDLMHEDTRRILENVSARSVMFAPLRAQDELLGSIGLDMISEARAFTDEERTTFLTIARQIALATRNARLYEQALEANRLKSQFLANVSHELRTPLNAIIGYGEMLLAGMYGDLNEKQADRIARLNDSGRQLLGLINDVLDLSQLTDGDLRLDLALTQVSELVRGAVDAWQPRAHDKQLALHLEIGLDPASAEPLIQADSIYLRRALDSLLANAIKFTEQGSIAVRVQAVRLRGGVVYIGDADDRADAPLIPPARLHADRLPDGVWAAVTVQDTGIGIRPEDQVAIFERFRQGDGSTERAFSGAGIGLALTREIVALHGGLVWVNSALGQGSTFTLLLPTQPGMDEQPEAEDTNVGDDPRPLLIVVDDDDAALRLVSDFIGSAYRVLTTTQPTQVLKMARTLTPDLIITDVMMPIMNGWDLLRALKDDATTAAIPVVIMSIIDQRRMGMYMGAADYLLKPATREQLLSAIARVLESAEANAGRTVSQAT